MEMCGHRHAPSALPPGKNAATHWIGWVGPRAGLCVGGKEKNLLSVPWFETRVVQPVACHYTDYTILPQSYLHNMKYVRVCINLTIYVQIILSHSLVVIRLTAVVRGESVLWSIDVTVSNPKPLAQLPLAVPSIDIQLKTWRSEFHVPGNAASSKRNCIPRLHARCRLCCGFVVMWLYGQLLIISLTAVSCLRRLSYVPSLFGNRHVTGVFTRPHSHTLLL